MPIQGIILAACMRVHVLRISHPLPPTLSEKGCDLFFANKLVSLLVVWLSSLATSPKLSHYSCLAILYPYRPLFCLIQPVLCWEDKKRLCQCSCSFSHVSRAISEFFLFCSPKVVSHGFVPLNVVCIFCCHYLLPDCIAFDT